MVGTRQPIDGDPLDRRILRWRFGLPELANIANIISPAPPIVITMGRLQDTYLADLIKVVVVTWISSSIEFLCNSSTDVITKVVIVIRISGQNVQLSL